MNGCDNWAVQFRGDMLDMLCFVCRYDSVCDCGLAIIVVVVNMAYHAHIMTIEGNACVILL